MVRHPALNLLQISKNKFKDTSLKRLRKKAGWGNYTLRTNIREIIIMG